MKRYKFKRLLMLGLGNIASGIFFGIGCVIVEHVDSTWWQAKETSQQETAANENKLVSSPNLKLDVADVKNKK